jgi:pimeloyl-ACP methyl ester carboxylesterase
MSTTLFKRSNRRVRFKNEDMDFAFQWLLGYHTYGGASFGELFHAASAIRDGDPASWVEAFLTLGQRLRAYAEELERTGRQRSAHSVYLRAFTGFRGAAVLMSPLKDDRYRATVDSFEECFARAMPGFGHRVEVVGIPFGANLLPAHLHLADRAPVPRPSLIIIGGGESFVQDLHFWAGAAGPKRGYNVLAVDLPGQGGTPLRGMFLRPDFEHPVAAVVDYLLSRPDVDRARIAAYGISGGGYAVTRAVSFERRIAAAIADTPIHDMVRVMTRSIPSVLLRPSGNWLGRLAWKLAGRANPVAVNNLEEFAWRTGMPSVARALDRFGGDARVNVVTIECPMLCLAGEADPPECLTQTREVFEQLRDARKQMRVFTAAEGAEAHCHVDNFPLLQEVVFDWLDTVLQVGSVSGRKRVEIPS